jgi:hypothetical protein
MTPATSVGARRPARTDPAMLGPARYERRAADLYETPTWVTHSLLRKVLFRGGIVWEPAAGNGAMCRPLEEHAYTVVASDIAERGYPVTVHDFLAPEPPGLLPPGPFSIVTNPPARHAEAFVRRALSLRDRGCGQVAMLMRHEYDCAASRRDMFERPPFARKIVLTKRPYWSEARTAAPRHNFAWFVWDVQHDGPPVLEYGP